MQFGPNGVGTERRDAAHRSPSLRHALDIEHRTQVVCTATGDLTQSLPPSAKMAHPSGTRCREQRSSPVGVCTTAGRQLDGPVTPGR
jgi:hypothetical protein